MKKVVNILGLNYEILKVNQIDKDTRIIGQIDYLNQTIKIENGLNEEKEKVTLIHETIHGILHQLGFDEQSDEKLIQSLATGLYQVLKENKTIFS